MSRDYDFWIYIVTNQHDSVLYIGITNSLTRRISEHRSGELPGFTAELSLPQINLLRALFERGRSHRARNTAKEMVASEEGRANRTNEPAMA
jgi:predicted GIY-YIG superfamily endonuclease